MNLIKSGIVTDHNNLKDSNALACTPVTVFGTTINVNFLRYAKAHKSMEETGRGTS